MSQIDALVLELEQIAYRSLGGLAADHARPAGLWLGLPRYQSAEDGAEQLVADIRTVLGGIHYEDAKNEPKSRLDRNAALVFGADVALPALDTPPSNRVLTAEFKERKKHFAEPGGSEYKWMRLTVLYRVLAGLLALQDPAPADQGPPTSNSGSGSPDEDAGFSIATMAMTRTITAHVLRTHVADEYIYEAILTRPGPHVLQVSHPRYPVGAWGSTYDSAAHKWKLAVHPASASTSSPDQVASRFTDPFSVVVFGAGHSPGTRLSIQLERRRTLREPWPVELTLVQPVGTFVLDVLPIEQREKLTLTRREPGDVRPTPVDAQDWPIVISDPAMGTRYTLGYES